MTKILAHLIATAFLFVIAASATRAEVVSVPFSEGFVGLRGQNNQDADTVVTFADLGFDATFFSQVSATGEFIGSGAQGNDVAGTLRLRRGAEVLDIDGRIGWQLKEQGDLKLFGFLPNSNIADIALSMPSGTTLPAGIQMKDVQDVVPGSDVYVTTGGESTYYISGASNFGVSKFGISLSDIKPLTSAPRGIDTGEDVGGSADGSGILDALNDYLASSESQRPVGPIAVNSQTTADTTPVVSGTVTLRSGEYLVILINGQVYTADSGVVQPADDGNSATWSIEIPAGSDLTAGETYDVSALIYNQAGWLLEDATTDEVTITNGVTSLPKLQVTKTVDASALNDGAVAGDVLTYEVVVSNSGNVPLYDLSWSDAITDGAGRETALTLGTPVKTGSGNSTTDGALLEVGDTLTFTMGYALTQSDIDSGAISNLATIEALSVDGDPASAFTVESSSSGNQTNGTGNGDATTRAISRAPAVNVIKTVAHTDGDGDGVVSVGDTLVYTLNVENTGNTTLRGVTLGDDFQRVDGTSLTATLSAIAYSAGSTDAAFLPGGTASATLTHVVDQGDVDAGGLSNSASATAWVDLNGDGQRAGDGGEDVTATTATPVSTTISRTPSVALRKSGVLNDVDGVAGTSIGDTISYVLEVRNTGDVTLTDVQIDDPLFGGVVGQTIAALAPGETDDTTFVLTYGLTSADLERGYVRNLALASATAATATVNDQSGPTFDTDEATVTFLGSISGQVTDGTRPEEGVIVILIDQTTGQEVARTVSSASGFYSFLQLEMGTYAIQFQPPEGGAVRSQSSNGDANGDQVQDIVVAAGAERLVADVDAIVVDPSGVIYDAISRAPIAGATVTLLHNGSVVPDTWLDTSAGDANNVQTGADGLYSFLLQSPAQSGTYSLSVSHPDYSFASQIVPPQAGSYTTSLGFGVEEIVASTTAPAASGGDATYYLEFDFTFADWTDPDALSKGVIHNHIAMDPRDFTTGIEITKIADDSALSERPQVGEIISYTITVENIGDLSYDTVLLDDPLTSDEALTPVAGVTDDGILNAGEQWVYTASYALTSSDLSAGRVANLATLSADLIAGSNAVTGGTPTGVDLGGTYVYESAPSGNATEGTGNGSATVVTFDVELIDQIAQDLALILEDDIRVTMQRQTEMVSKWRGDAAKRLRRALKDRDGLRSYQTTDRIDGAAKLTFEGLVLDGVYTNERYNELTRKWTIDSADIVFTQDDALGTQYQLTFNRRWESLGQGESLFGRYLGGYMTKTTVDTLAGGQIDGFGLNAGVYGARRLVQDVFLDYHLGGVIGNHSYDLDFDGVDPITATGDFTYWGVTGGVAVSGEMLISDTIVTPRLGLEGFYTPNTETEVTAISDPFRDVGTVPIESVSGGRIFVEAHFANDLSQAGDGAGLWDGLDGQLDLGLKAFCDAFDDIETRCGMGVGFDFVTAEEDGQTRRIHLDIDHANDQTALRFGIGFERRFARDTGLSSLNLLATEKGQPEVQYSLTLEF